MKKMKLSRILFLSLLLHQTVAVFFEGKNGINQKISKLASSGNNVYTFYTETCCNIRQANETCNKYNGFLAHVKTENVTSFINQQIEEYRAADDIGLWIGLHQIGDNTKDWEWSDKSKLDYNNWFDGEPNNKYEKCTDVQIIGDRFGFWHDSSCSIKKKIICENRAGSGFVTDTSIYMKKSEVKVQCVVFGGFEYSSIWLRNGVIVTNDTSKAIHQVYQRQRNYFKSTISFKGVLIEEAGTYNCFLKQNNNILKTLKLKVLTHLVDNVVYSWAEHGITQKISKLASFGNNVYTFYPETCCNINQANETCNKYDGFLAHVKSENVASFINQQIKEYQNLDFWIGFYIGLNQVGKYIPKWEWSDGEKLNYTNWRKDHKDHYKSRCVDISLSGNGLGTWYSSPCSHKRKFICQNRAGSGFVTDTSIYMKKSEVKVHCVVFGGFEYSSVWLRNGIIVTNDTNKTVHQVYQRQRKYFISTISFNGVLMEEAGTYNCIIKINLDILKTLELKVLKRNVNLNPNS